MAVLAHKSLRAAVGMTMGDRIAMKTLPSHSWELTVLLFAALAGCILMPMICGCSRARGLERAFPDKDPDGVIDLTVPVWVLGQSMSGGWYELPAVEYFYMILRDERGHVYLALLLGDPAGAEIFTRRWQWPGDERRVPGNVVALVPAEKGLIAKTSAPGIEVTAKEVVISIERNVAHEARTYIFRLRRFKGNGNE